MSKSNINDSDISSKYIEFLINAVGETNASIQALSNSYKSSLREQRKSYEDLVKAFNKGEISSDKLAKGFEKALKTVQSVDYGIRRTERYNDSARTFFKELAKEIRAQLRKTTSKIKPNYKKKRKIAIEKAKKIHKKKVIRQNILNRKNISK